MRPANALTLEEIQAKENITASPSQQVENDHMQFNQILAVLSGSKSSGHTQPSGSSSGGGASAVMVSSVMQPPTTGLPTNSTLAYHLDTEVVNHHLPPPNQHRVDYLHYPRPPPPRASNHMQPHSCPLPWSEPSTKPQAWVDEERAMAGNRQQYVTAASQSQAHWVSEMDQRRVSEMLEQRRVSEMMEQRRLVEAKQMYSHHPPRAQMKVHCVCDHKT